MTSTISPTEHSTAIRPWPLVALDPHVQITSGESPSLFRFGPSGTPYFKVQQLGMRMKYLHRQDTPYLALNAPEVAKGSVVFAKRGAAIQLNKIRILAEPGYMDTNIMALTPVGDFTTEYLFYALTFFGLWSVADITSVPQINNKHIKPLCLPLPSKDEQRAITSALSDVDSPIATLERLISKKEATKRGVMQQLLSGKTRLPGFAGPWKEWSMGSLGTTYGGLVGKTKDDFGVGQDRYIPFMAVMAGTRATGKSLLSVRVGSAEHQNVIKTGDLLFNTSSETPDELAMCAVATDLPGDTYLNSFCFGFRLAVGDTADALFLAYLFRSGVGRRLMRTLAQGAIRYNLSKAQFRNVVVVLPPIDEQRAIAGALEDIDAVIEALRDSHTKAKAIKQGMMQELLTGRTRLPVAEVVTA